MTEAGGTEHGPLWIFGYGSLVWRPAFPHVEQQPGFIVGWTRRFWQHSTDHRGVPGAPGRVVTLRREAGAHCWGMAFRVGEDDRQGVLTALDHREKNGYARHWMPVQLAEQAGPAASAGPVRALVYIATDDNPDFAGPAPLSAIAAQIRRSRGPSGDNVQYVLALAAALRAMGAQDDHVLALADLLEPSPP